MFFTNNRNGACRFLFLLITFVCSLQPGWSQQFRATERSAEYISDRDYDSIIRHYSLPIARRKNIAEASFDSRYPESRPRFAELLTQMLSMPFADIDKRAPASGKTSAGYQKIRSAYLQQLSNSVKRLLENPLIFSPLFSTDVSDRILNFHSDIVVAQDGEIEVTETIRVYNGNGSAGELISSNDDIKRGIVRDFPTKYLDSNGFWKTTSFKLKVVKKNGIEEPYIKESLSNGTRIKTGSKDVLLPEGIFTYQLKYSTQRQVIFHPDKDELYWNVNGTGWVFTADSITATIHFPETAKIIEAACYTGTQGSTAQQCRFTGLNSNTIHFAGSSRFNSYEGLTIAASIPKGIISSPSALSELLNTIGANYYVFLLGLVSIAFIVYYFRSWSLYGRDPKQGTIIPQFEPPAGLLPADVGYILEQKFGPHLFAATLVDAAVHKDLTIEVDKKGWLIKKQVYSFVAPAEQRSVVNARYHFDISRIYGQTAERGKYNPVLKGLQDAVEAGLKSRFLIKSRKDRTAGGLFRLNTGYTVFGIFILIAAVVGGLIFLTSNFSVVLVLICAILFLSMVIVHLIFSRIMSSYTREGRVITDHILGFRMYLSQAEQRIFDQLTPPEKTLELFEKYLPYAIALKVENKWAGSFEAILQQALEQGYQPSYFYTGGHFGSSFSASDLGAGVSSGLSGTISSASTPPSSSGGGSGGGGSSGGGGGGGGGGGW